MSKSEIDADNTQQSGDTNKIPTNTATRALHITRNKRTGPGPVKTLKPSPAIQQAKVPNTLKDDNGSSVVVQDSRGRVIGKGKLVQTEGTQQVVLKEFVGFDPVFSDYEPRTRLGQTLKTLRAKAISNGVPLLGEEELHSEIDLIKGRPSS